MSAQQLTRFGEYCAMKVQQYGDKFDDAELLPEFVPYFNSGQRIKVQTPAGILTGTVGVTTGWRPAFLLMRRSNAISSSSLIRAGWRVVAVWDGRRYR